jgi:hypothetical protein
MIEIIKSLAGLNLQRFRDIADLRYAARHRQESGIKLTGNVHLKHTRGGLVLLEGWEPNPNTFTTEGMAYLLNIIFGTTSKTGSAIWYVGIFKGDVTPAVGDTAAAKLGAAGTYQECQDADYDAPLTNKPSYTIAATSTAVCTNAAAKANFVMNAGITVYGAFLGDAAAKTGTGGKLMCAKRFASSRAVIADDELAVTYQITCTTS